MITLFEEAAELQRLLTNEGLEFFFVGGIPLQVWGMPRLTTDIDITVFTGLIDEDKRIGWFLDHFEPLIGDRDSTFEFARSRRVLLLKSNSGTEIDVMLGGLGDISEEYYRSSFQQFSPTVSLRICSAETLIAMKTVAQRGQDFVDIESVLIKQDDLDWTYIDAYLDQVMEYEDISEARMNLQSLRNSTKT